MEPDISHSEIDKLEKELIEFSAEWESNQILRASKWRKWVLIGFIATLVSGFLFPKLWWFGIILIAYSAGSLYMLIDQQAKISAQILEHKKQIKLARMLLNFNSTL